MAGSEIKDSFYFMKDDGIFSDAEKDEEALFIFDECARDHFKNIYRDCECIAGAFRGERDDEKLVPQHHILTKLYDDDNQQCVNTPAIAASNYDICIRFSSAIRRRENDHEEFCKCVANNVANNFKKRPLLNTRHIEKLRTKAFQSCD